MVFWSPSGVTHRLYINVERSHCVDVLEFVLQCIVTKTECHGAKILPPSAIGTRSDCIVLYLTKGGLLFAKKAILASTLPRTYFGRGIPVMTERLMGGIGVSSGEEPPQVAIGVKPLQRGAQDQQSFVTFRSELLVASLLQFCENHSDLGHYLYPLFEGTVMDAFRAYGIDPSMPWQGTS